MKKLSLLFVVLLVAAMVMGCGSNNSNSNSNLENDESVSWSITVEGIDDGAIEFTNLDAAKLTTRKVEAVLTKKDGSEQKQNWEGVALKDVLESLGAKDYQSVIVEAADGYSQEYSLEIINREETLLGLKLNGEPLDEESGPVQAVPTGEPGNLWIKNVTRLIVR